MTRRTAVRRPRRVSVRFWKQGDTTGFAGHTTNISTTGMFLATNSPAPSGARVRIEVIERDRGFVVEGVVAHARKVRPELARITESGMGIRFLNVDELVRELLPGAGGVHDEVAPTFAPYAPEAAPSAAPVLPPPAHEPHAAAAPAAAPPLPPPASTPFPPPQAPSVARISDIGAPFSAPERTAPAAPPPLNLMNAPTPAGGVGTFAVRFGTPAEFLEVYRRDILNGGLFVSTRFPARIQETVVVQLYPPFVGAEPISVRARVVQRFEPQSGDLSPNLLSGMGLELVDLASIVEKMLPVIARLVGS